MKTELVNGDTLRTTFRGGNTFDQVVGDNLRFTDGWPIHERNLKILLGVPHRMPADFWQPPKMLGNVKVAVYTAECARVRAPKSRFAHRVIATCPECGKLVGAGKLHQHMKIHKSE